MPSTLSTFSASEAAMRYKEPYVTDGLNRKMLGAVPRGIYRGFTLAVDPGAGDRTVLIQADTDNLDHLAVYETANGYSISIRKTGGNFVLSLAAYTSVTVVVALYAIYSVGTTTSAIIRAYTQAEFDVATEKDELVVLGTVIVPISGVINSVKLLKTQRVSAWENVAVDAQAPVNLLVNGDFHIGATTLLSGLYTSSTAYQPIWYWRVYIGSANTSVQRSASLGRAQRGAVLVKALAAGTVSTNLFQFCGTPIDPTKQRFRGRLYYKRLQAVTVAGAIRVFAHVSQNAAVPDTILLTDATVAAGGPDSDYQLVEWDYDTAIDNPTSGNYGTVVQIEVEVNYPTVGAAGDAIEISDVEAYVSSANPGSRSPSQFRPTYSPFVVLKGELPDQPSTKGSIIRQESSTSVGLRLEDLSDGHTVGTNVLSWLFEGQLRLGKKLADGAASNVFVPLLKIPADTANPTYRTLFAEHEVAGGTSERTRIYLSADGDYFYTVNAKWDGANWSKDDTASFSFMLTLWRGDVPGFYRRVPGAGTWADGAWIAVLYFDPSATCTTANRANHLVTDNGILVLSNPITGSSAGDSNLNATATPGANTLYAKNICKAWGVITTDGAGNSTIQTGFNINSTVTLTATTIVVNFNVAFAESCEVSTTGSAGADFVYVFGIVSRTVTSVTLRILKVQNGVNPDLIDPTTTALELDLSVFGKQT